jgi:predicted MPP superfamily phosphohydrolase
VASVVRSLAVYKRAVLLGRTIILLLILALSTLLIAYGDFFDLLLFALFLIFIASQIFWITRIIDVGERLLPGQLGRARVAIIVDLAYLFVIAYSYPTTIGQGHTFRLCFYRLPNTMAEVVFWWWFVGSMSAFVLVIVFGIADRAVRAAAWVYRKARRTVQRHVTADSEAATPSPSRRHFLQQTAVVVSATPFVAASYGLLYERLDVEVVRQRIRLARLPKAFEGFRIAQLSDIHMGPFATADYIRRCVAITNGLKPDLIVLTGDYIAWDPGAERDVVQALAGLRAPHGVFACLGNHESESETEQFVTDLSTSQGIRVLRQENKIIQLGGEEINLIGIDDPRGESEAEWKRDAYRRLNQALVMPGTVNLLLAHEPSVFMFDRAADLGVDLMLAGHTHGGQLSLSVIDRSLNLSQLLYRYTSGWYEKRGTQLYVNRGIGTTGFPIRLGARPEISVFELFRT